jgi:opacity protein-like surface antigen
MKKLSLAIAALAALAAPAFGADLGPRSYAKAPAYAAPIYAWTGFYVGGHLGGALSGGNNFGGLVLSDYEARLLGGVQAGADWQFAPSFVVGKDNIAGPARTTSTPSSPPVSSTTTTSAGSARSPAASATPRVRRCSTSRAVTPIPTIARR